MCGIFCVFGKADVPTDSSRLGHRGPDDFGTYKTENCYMEFSRLSINDTSPAGMQPFTTDAGDALVCNGEIYNHEEFMPNEPNDCKCLIPLIKDHGIFATVDMIRGVFAICYTDGRNFFAARDPFGVRPLFYKRDYTGAITFASEIKAFGKINSRVEVFPPGHIYDSRLDKFTCYYPCYWNLKSVYTSNAFERLRETLTEAVRRRITNTDRKMCFFLSGGLDSSLMVAIARKLLGPDAYLKTFSIGTEDSPDCKAAREVAEYLKTDHTEVRFDVQAGLESLYDVIRSLETYDTTTIRASTPMWTLSKYISEKTDYRVVISGEGSDEVMGGYLYFHYAPSVSDFVNENTRRLQLIHQFDVLRADRSTAAHGLEMRVPFLDRDFVECAMSEIDQNLKTVDANEGRSIEKWVLRKAFSEGGYLPESVLWRQKDAFSDAVGYSWMDELKAYAKKIISPRIYNEEMLASDGYNMPTTEEEVMYRGIFREMYMCPHVISEYWRPKWTGQSDPSARLLAVHNT